MHFHAFVIWVGLSKRPYINYQNEFCVYIYIYIHQLEIVVELCFLNILWHYDSTEEEYKFVYGDLHEIMLDRIELNIYGWRWSDAGPNKAKHTDGHSERHEGELTPTDHLS